MLLQHAFGETLRPPVSTGAGGSAPVFYCKAAGCAADVTLVFCNDKPVQHGLLPDCSAPLLLHTACQRDGRAFVSSPAGTGCQFEGDFEGERDYIPTQRCTGTDPNCLWFAVSSPSPTTSNKEKKAAAISPGHVALAVIGGTKYFSWDPLWRNTRMRFSIQKSAAMFVIHVMSMLLQHAFGQTLRPPVSTGAGGSDPVFYCKAAGCAADVTLVFCNDKPVQHGLLPDCSAPLLLHTACQRDGRAFVSSPAGTGCQFEGDFEGERDYIPTQRCTGTDPNCLWFSVSSPSPTTSNKEKKAAAISPGHVALAVIGGIALVALMGGVARYLWKRCRGSNQQLNSGPDVHQQVTELQLLGEVNERDVEAAVPVDDDAIPQRGHGD
ncbi:uncharacterized protein V3H82_008410 [Fundulus diaphanus]